MIRSGLLKTDSAIFLKQARESRMVSYCLSLRCQIFLLGKYLLKIVLIIDANLAMISNKSIVIHNIKVPL